MKLLFICLGNICRSPMAEALFKYHLTRMSLLSEFEVDSCGTGGWHAGELPDHRMIQTAGMHEIPMTHKARKIKDEDFENYDLLLVMDNQNYKDVISLRPDMKHKVSLICKESYGTKQEIPDPFFGDMDGFNEVFQLLNKVTLALVIKLNQYTENQ